MSPKLPSGSNPEDDSTGLQLEVAVVEDVPRYQVFGDDQCGCPAAKVINILQP
jgi:hypothetical protein